MKNDKATAFRNEAVTERISMETKNLEQVKELINRIADYYDLPTDEQTEEMRKLTGMDWSAEDLQMQCCEYWSHNSLEETAYLLFHGDYPPVREIDLIFWRYKPGVVMDAQAVFEKYRLGKGKLKALEALPLEEILQKITEQFSGWPQSNPSGNDNSWRFDCSEPTEYWMDTHFRIFEYGRETDSQREHQILKFSCHNMSDEQIKSILDCMASFQCPLQIREEKNLLPCE